MEAVLPTNVAMETPAIMQRVLPIGLVALTEPAKIGSKTFEMGRLFFKVFNDEGKTGYCPAPGRRIPDALAMFRVPILDQKPCLVDRDKDGRFDAVFSAFEQAGGVPTYRGSINAAKPLPASVGFRQEDIHNYPNDLEIGLVLTGKWPNKISAKAHFSRDVLTEYAPVSGKYQDGSVHFKLMNLEMIVTAVEGDRAQVELSMKDEIVLVSDFRGNIYWRPLPPAALAD